MDGMANGTEIGALTWFLLVLVGALLIGGLFGLMWWFGMPYGNRRGLQRKKAQRVSTKAARAARLRVRNTSAHAATWRASARRGVRGV